MTLKMKLTSLIASFTLVVGLMLMGVFAVNQATVNMGGSINFTATDVYARVTGKIENAQGEYANKELPPIEFSAENDTPDQSEWSGLNLLFDDDATPIEVTITVENLSTQNTLRVNLNDKLSSTVENFEKVVENDGRAYTNHTDITLQPNGQENDSTTFTITMSVTNKNNSLTADFDYELNLFDQYYVPQIYDYFTFKENGDGTVELTAFDEDLAPSTDIVIPATVAQNESGQWTEGNTYTVTDIFSPTSYRNGVFYDSGITSIELPATLETIGDDAFYKCSGLTSITLPPSLTSIGSSAFGSCTGLTGALDLSNCTSLTSIGDDAFYNCSGLTSITLPSSLTSIGSQVFINSNELETLEYKGTLEQWLSIEFGSFWMDDISHTFIVNGEELTNLVVPEGVTSIGNSAFYGCSGLTSITLPSSLISIGEYAFQNCSGIETLEYKGTIDQWLSIDFSSTWTLDSSHTFIVNEEELTNLVVPEGVTSIGERAFYGCSGLTSITLPSSLTSIGDWAFQYCGRLSGELDLGNCTRLTSIGNAAFYGCSGLTSITLPSSLTSIGGSAFFDCSGFTSVTINQYVFENVTSTSSSCGYILSSIGYGRTVLVPANLIDDLHLTNSYLDDESEFTRSATANEDGYYVYTKI